MTSNVDIRILGSGRLGRGREAKTEETKRAKEEGREGRYLLVRQIRDQPTGTLMLAPSSASFSS